MDDKLFRVESAISATSSGNLTWNKWPLDCAIALGLSGQRNPLGFAMVRWLEATDGHRTRSEAAWGLALQLAAVLLKLGHDKAKVNDLSFRSIYAFNQRRCGHCGGRGVVSFDQKGCPVCAGTGEKPIADWPADVRDGLSALLDAERWMEGQLAARLRGSSYVEPEGHKVNLPCRDNQDDLGFDRHPVTPRRANHGNRSGG